MKKDVPIRGLQWVLSFGKHKGELLEKVIKEDPTYIDWCLDERIFVLDDEADEALTDSLAGLDDTFDRFDRYTSIGGD